MKNATVAVIGAGMAGMAAARELARSGSRVRVFDKSRGVGGRMATRRHETGAFDHGAQYFTARSPEFEARVADWCARGLAAPWDARVVRLTAGGKIDASDPEERHVGVPKMSVLARDLAQGLEDRLEIHCDTPIEAARPGPGGWRLETRDGVGIGPFGALVLAVPSPQVPPLLADVTALAELRARVAEVEIDPCQAVLVSFRERLPTAFEAAFVVDSPLSWIARNGSKPGRPEGECWVLHGTPGWSRAHVETTPDEVVTCLLAAFEEAIGRPLPETRHVGSHRWLYARTRTPADRACEWRPREAIGLCGDWLLGCRVEDAFRSGRALAREMITLR